MSETKKRRTPAQELALLLRDIAAAMHVDAELREQRGEAADVAAWANVYNEASALCTRLLHGVVD